MTTYDATGNTRQPTIEEIRHWFLAATKDGDPSPLQTDIPLDDPRYKDHLRIVEWRKQAWEIYREIICMASTAKGYLDLEQSAKMILQATNTAGKPFAQYLKAFLALVSIHSIASGNTRGRGKIPSVSMTGEFWGKEWVPLVFEKLREFDAKHKNSGYIAKIYEAMARGATDKFVRGGTIGAELITYIAMNAVWWKDEGKTDQEIHDELKAKGFNRWAKDRRDAEPEAEKQDYEENVRKARSKFAQYGLRFVDGKSRK